MRFSRLVLCISLCDYFLGSASLRSWGWEVGRSGWRGWTWALGGHVKVPSLPCSSLRGSVWRMSWASGPGFLCGGGGGYVGGERGELLLGWGCWAHTRKPGRRGQPGGAGVERGGGDTGSLLGHLLLCWAPASPLGMLGIYMSISIYRKDNTHRDSCCLSLAAQLVSSRARIQG